MANIDKELNQIKNAVYGKDVRGSIHDGIDKINKETEVATDKSEQAHDVMESIINDGFDNAALESNFEQKLDDKIADLQPEWTQFKDQTNQQLAEKAINVKALGAKGDGVNDDTGYFIEAFNLLYAAGGGTLYVPSGLYIITSTLKMPSNVTVEGSSKDGTILKAVNAGVYQTINPINGSAPNRGKYKSLLTTRSAGTENETTVKNVVVRKLTIDWNWCTGDTFSLAPLWIDSAKNCLIEDVEILNALDGVDTERKYGCSTLVSFSEDVIFDRVILHEADYESLSVRFLSKNIYFKNGVIDSEKPSKYQGQSHQFQLARPSDASSYLLAKYGEEKPGPLYVHDNVFRPGGGVAHVGTAHTSKGFFIYDNFVEVKETAKMAYIFKTFADTDDTRFDDNYILFKHGLLDDMVPQILSLDSVSADTANSNGYSIKGNTIEFRFPDNYIPTTTNVRDRTLIGGNAGGTNFNGVIKENIIKLENVPNLPIKVITISGNRQTVTDNVINIISQKETQTTDGMVGIYLRVGVDNIITNNILGSVKIGTGIELNGATTIVNNIITGNNVMRSFNPINTNGKSQNIIKDNITENVVG